MRLQWWSGSLSESVHALCQGKGGGGGAGGGGKNDLVGIHVIL